MAEVKGTSTAILAGRTSVDERIVDKMGDMGREDGVDDIFRVIGGRGSAAVDGSVDCSSTISWVPRRLCI